MEKLKYIYLDTIDDEVRPIDDILLVNSRQLPPEIGEFELDENLYKNKLSNC